LYSLASKTTREGPVVEDEEETAALAFAMALVVMES